MSLKELADAVCDADSDRARLLSEQMLKKGIPPKEILAEGLTRGLNKLGRLWNKGEAFLTEVLLAIETFNNAFEVVKPHLEEKGSERLGRIIIGTVAGDIHYIGKNIVATILEGNGFEVMDLGEDVSTSAFCDAVSAENPNILAMSCLVSTSLSAMEAVVRELKNRGLREKVKVMIGGPPVTLEFVNKIGADIYALDAFEATEIAKEAIAR